MFDYSLSNTNVSEVIKFMILRPERILQVISADPWTTRKVEFPSLIHIVSNNLLSFSNIKDPWEKNTWSIQYYNDVRPIQSPCHLGSMCLGLVLNPGKPASLETAILSLSLGTVSFQRVFSLAHWSILCCGEGLVRHTCPRMLLPAAFQLLAPQPWSMVWEGSAAQPLLGNCFLGDRGVDWVGEVTHLDLTKRRYCLLPFSSRDGAEWVCCLARLGSPLLPWCWQPNSHQ